VKGDKLLGDEVGAREGTTVVGVVVAMVTAFVGENLAVGAPVGSDLPLDDSDDRFFVTANPVPTPTPTAATIKKTISPMMMVDRRRRSQPSSVFSDSSIVSSIVG
jgi:hypothetical protein